MDGNDSWGRVLAAVALLALTAILIGPRVAQAVGDIVTIEGAGSANRAKVGVGGRFFVDTESTTRTLNGRVSQNTIANPAGEAVLANKIANPRLDCAIITAITVDAAAAATVKLITPEGDNETWIGRIPAAGGHIEDTFPNGLLVNDTDVTTTGSPDFYVYGESC